MDRSTEKRLRDKNKILLEIARRLQKGIRGLKKIDGKKHELVFGESYICPIAVKGFCEVKVHYTSKHDRERPADGDLVSFLLSPQIRGFCQGDVLARAAMDTIDEYIQGKYPLIVGHYYFKLDGSDLGAMDELVDAMRLWTEKVARYTDKKDIINKNIRAAIKKNLLLG